MTEEADRIPTTPPERPELPPEPKVSGVEGRLEEELAATRAGRDAFAHDRDGWKTKYHEQHERVAVLEERLNSFRERRITRNIMITLGGIVAGFGLQALSGPNWAWGLVACLLAVLLLVGVGGRPALPKGRHRVHPLHRADRPQLKRDC